MKNVFALSLLLLSLTLSGCIASIGNRPQLSPKSPTKKACKTSDKNNFHYSEISNTITRSPKPKYGKLKQVALNKSVYSPNMNGHADGGIVLLPDGKFEIAAMFDRELHGKNHSFNNSYFITGEYEKDAPASSTSQVKNTKTA